MTTEGQAVEYAILGGGCFWCLEAVFELLPGVIDVENGYAGGSREQPSYEEVSTGETGHAEVVRIAFDPAKLAYEEILDLFWKIHDPTTEDRQGADIGSQYRSVIFTTSEEQLQEAAASIKETQHRLVDPIVTELLPSPRFWPAESYHQDYFRKHPDAAYCRIVIAPKLKKAGF
ncbi:MAG: peptide-methionine (S)-S-oxide reductase MsrA [Spirochaetaceae bacterium]|nr:peptide-methionine (S)-S-oxide reductase MsrA [Spirochaetaceae bacterium]